MQCKYYQKLLGWTCEWSLRRGGRFIEVVFKTGSTVSSLINACIKLCYILLPYITYPPCFSNFASLAEYVIIPDLTC